MVALTKSVTMTTIDNIREIYDELEKEGVKDILSIYKGWQKGGLYKVLLPLIKRMVVLEEQRTASLIKDIR